MTSFILIFEMFTSHKCASAYIDCYYCLFINWNNLRYLGYKHGLGNVNKAIANHVSWCSAKFKFLFLDEYNKSLKFLCQGNI